MYFAYSPAHNLPSLVIWSHVLTHTCIPIHTAYVRRILSFLFISIILYCTLQVGVFVTMRIGTGLVIARRRDGSWSAPSAVASGGLGWGFQIGGELTDMVIVLNTVGAVEAFAGRGQVRRVLFSWEIGGT